jgi:5-methylcytosine-specific restriction enzyme subunit McrC
VTWTRLLPLVRYAFELRHLTLHGRIRQGLAELSFQDLLVHQLTAEAADLVARGLHHEYEPHRRSLTTPHGRIDFQVIARQGGVTQAALPCRFHRWTEDTTLNRALLAGLRFASEVAIDPQVRSEARRWAGELEEHVRAISLSRQLIADAWRSSDRRTSRYRPALTLIEHLRAGAGVTLYDADRHVPLRGFVFDMNRFWQRLLSRLLRESRLDLDIRDEYRLSTMFSAVLEYRPRPRQRPTLKPDFVVLARDRVVALLDAKYRDLWVSSLPADMLYQLTVYALSQPQGATATILYPAQEDEAREERIQIHDPLHGGARAYVALRPVHLTKLEELLGQPFAAPGSVLKRRGHYVEYLLHGSTRSAPRPPATPLAERGSSHG